MEVFIMKKWWDSPITWKQSIICGTIGLAISLVSWWYLVHADDIKDKIDDIHNFICKKRKTDD